MKYELTRWQRIILPLIWILWATHDPTTRKTWHEVKKGMERHEHTFTIMRPDGLLKCSHEGCTLCHDPQWD